MHPMFSHYWFTVDNSLVKDSDTENRNIKKDAKYTGWATQPGTTMSPNPSSEKDRPHGLLSNSLGTINTAGIWGNEWQYISVKE